VPAPAANPALESLFRSARCRRDTGPADGQLLEGFVADRDEAAFEALVRRHVAARRVRAPRGEIPGRRGEEG